MNNITFIFLLFFISTGKAFEIFYSQQNVVSPCDGTLVLFDYGYMNVTMTTAGTDHFNGDIKVKTSIRNLGDTYATETDNSFTTGPVNKLSFRQQLGPFSFYYVLECDIQSGQFSSISLGDIQVWKC